MNSLKVLANGNSSRRSSTEELSQLRELVEQYRNEVESIRKENISLAEEVHSLMVENTGMRMEKEASPQLNKSVPREANHYMKGGGMQTNGHHTQFDQQKELADTRNEAFRLECENLQLRRQLHDTQMGLSELVHIATSAGVKIPKGGALANVLPLEGGWQVRSDVQTAGSAGRGVGEIAKSLRMAGQRERFSCLDFFQSKSTGDIMSSLPVGRIAMSDLALTKPLGSGVFALVSSGEWKISCAVKKMKPPTDKSKTRSHLNAFVREGEMLRRMNHPNIVKLIGVVADAENLCFVLEKAAGENLAELIHKHKRKIELDKQLVMVAQVASALAYVHSLNVVHRDVKPENIIFNQAKMSCKLIDFGLSRLLPHGHTSVVTEPGGTPAYWPPEVLRTGATNRVHVCRKADQFGFAICFWELYTLRLPWTGVTLEQLCTNVIRGDRPPIPADMPYAYAEVICACWANDVETRPEFEHVIAVVSALREELVGKASDAICHM